MKHSYFEGRVTLLHFDGIEDSRGVLTPIDFETLNFSPIRTFLVNGKNGISRGGHAHREGTQLLLRISGEIHVDLSLNGEEKSIVLGQNANALLLCAPVWSRQTYRGDAPRLLVFSDHPFDPDGYLPDKG